LLVNEPRIGVPPLDGPQVARVLQMPYESFRKKFVALAGVSPGQYRARRLLERAGELLQHGQLNNRQIAARLGFCDEFHFSRQFKKHHGASPRDWKLRQNSTE
jgi:AraC-like DNA-binding protein